MFTGMVEELGSVVRLLRRGGGARLEVRASRSAPFTIGESVSINGACVTVTETSGEVFACDLVPETVARTNLGILQVGDPVNVERPMRAGDRFGGHIVQGHVDAVGSVRSRRKVGAQEVLEVTVPFELTRYLAPQGSVAVDGVSLTVVAVDRDRFRVALIPHTVNVTTLGQKIQGSPVNVEVDVLSKYVERHLAARSPRPAPLFEEPPREVPETPRQRPAVTAALRAAGLQKPVARPQPAAKTAPKATAAKATTKASKTSKPAAKRPAAKRSHRSAPRGSR